MKKFFAVSLLALGLAACSDEPNTIRVLTDEGMTDIKTDGFAYFACGKDDTFATEFSATNLAGRRVSGAVCSGWFKGYTIRYY